MLTHIRPLTPESLTLSFWTAEMVLGFVGRLKARRTEMISSLRRSRYFAGSERCSTWSSATRAIRGIFGSRSRNSLYVSISLDLLLPRPLVEGEDIPRREKKKGREENQKILKVGDITFPFD